MSSPLDGIRSIRDLPIENKRVFMRVDFNVPLEGRATITDDSRIREALPTIKHALERGARLVCASHLGRPKKGPDPKLLARAVRRRASRSSSGRTCTLPEDCVGDAAKKVVYDLRGGQVCLLENLRFHPEEEKDDEAFCRRARRAGRRLRRRRVRRRAPRARERSRAARSSIASAAAGSSSRRRSPRSARS